MRIVLLGFVNHMGGIRSHIRWLSQSLIENNCQVLVVSIGIYQEKSQFESFEFPGIDVLYLEPKKPNSLISPLTKLCHFQYMAAEVRRFQPDVYLCMGTGWLASLLPLALPSKVRTIFFEVMSGVISDWRDPRWGVRLWFDEVVGQSPKVAESFRKNVKWHKRISAIPAMPEPLELTAILPQISTSKVIEMGKARAALFSRLVPHKQAFWLVQQWDRLKDILGELHIHGSGTEESLIREYIKKQGIGDRVKCFGRYPEGQKYVDLLSNYDLTLLPTIGDEGAPIVLLESMACGVPFVAYGAGGISDYSINNPNSLVIPLHNEDFISGIAQMACKLAHGKIDQGALQQFYLENYSYKRLGKIWLSYLCEKL
jgi:glycosyltransferase involved in cell wall biosynthesis